jgi:catechol 2,3-dioxygenase-like lactoylglutathione lyase family enzyme
VAALAFNLLVVRASDLQASRQFYEGLGLKLTTISYGSGEVYRCCLPPTGNPFVDPSQEPVPVYFEIHPRTMGRPVTTGLVLGLYVSSVDVAVQGATAAGGKVLSPPAHWPYGRRAAVADPDGNRVELSEDVFGRPTGAYPV